MFLRILAETLPGFLITISVAQTCLAALSTGGCRSGKEDENDCSPHDPPHGQTGSYADVLASPYSSELPANLVFYVALVLTTLIPLAYNQCVLRRAQATDDLHACLLIAKANTGPWIKRLRLFTIVVMSATIIVAVAVSGDRLLVVQEIIPSVLLIIVSLAKLYQSAGKDKKVPYIQVEPFYAECKDNIPPDTFDDMRHSRGKYMSNKLANNVRVVEIAAVELVKHRADKLARGDTSPKA
jgi:hypothetical protein